MNKPEVLRKIVVNIVLVDGVEGDSLYIDDTRICGRKPWGGGKVIMTWKEVPLNDILNALPQIQKHYDQQIGELKELLKGQKTQRMFWQDEANKLDIENKKLKDQQIPTEEEIFNIMDATWAINLGENRDDRFRALAKAIRRLYENKAD